MRQGNDLGTQYQSRNLCTTRLSSRPRPRSRGPCTRSGSLKRATGRSTTQIVPAGEFYFAEDYHQQYLSEPGTRTDTARTTGPVSLCPIGVVKASDWACRLGSCSLSAYRLLHPSDGFVLLGKTLPDAVRRALHSLVVSDLIHFFAYE